MDEISNKLEKINFLIWLGETMKSDPTGFFVLKDSFDRVNTMLYQKHIISKPLIIITQRKQIEKIIKETKRTYGNIILRRTAVRLLNKYLAYRKEHPYFESPEEPKELLPDNGIKYDFTNSKVFQATYPVDCSIGGTKIVGKNWARILTAITENEIAKKNSLLNNLYEQPLMPPLAGRPYFLKEKLEGLNCSKLNNGYWINVNHSIPRLLEYIGELCLHCGYKKEEIVLYGVPKSEVGRKPFTGSNIGIKPLPKQLSDNDKIFIKILTEHFTNGYRLGSVLSGKRLKKFYTELTGKEIDIELEQIEAEIKKLGVIHDGYLYMPQNMLSDEMRTRVFSFIADCFAEGKTAIYYNALFNEFHNDFLDHKIYDADMLKSYLKYYYSDTYYMGKSYISQNELTEIDPVEEIREYLMNQGSPTSVDDICTALSHLSAKRVQTILWTNSEFISNARREYFHVDSLKLTEEELDNISDLIDASILEHRFISGNELYEAIQQKYPNIFEKNSIFSVMGWRDALKYRFNNRFSFNGNIISRAGETLTMRDVYADFARTRKRFTLDELDCFAESLSAVNSGSYIGALYPYAIRLNLNEFVAKNEVKFQTHKTDAVLERICTGRYIPLHEIREFAILPEATKPWTDFLLEQYIAFYSDKFYLMHGSFNKNCTAGAIVKRAYKYETFEEFITDVLSDSDIILKKNEALNYLMEKGYIARRYLSNIEALLINARALRNRKEKK